MADDLKDRRTKFGPKGFKSVSKTEAGRLKHIRMGARFNVPETIKTVMRRTAEGKMVSDTMASAKRVYRHFAPIIGKSVKRGMSPDIEAADRAIRAEGKKMKARSKSRKGNKTDQSIKVSRKSSRRSGASRSY